MPGPGAPGRGGRAGLVDLAGTAALVGCGLYGFGRAYGGTDYLVTGLLGIALGMLVAAVAERFRAPALTTAAVTVAAFFLLGNGIALHGPRAATPTPAALTDLADVAVHGWSRLLTVLPPAGSTGNLLVIPYLLGLVATVTGHSLARRTARAWVPLVVPLTVLVTSVLFGTQEPASLLVQGAGFAVLAIGWLALRSRRRRLPARRPGLRQVVGGVALLAVAGGAGFVAGPRLPLAGARERQVLRDHLDPPFDPRAYASPLSQFRRFALPGPGRVRDDVLFTVDGLPPGALVRIATMDRYDGTVWAVSAGGREAGPSAGGPEGTGYFQRVGETIPTTRTGRAASMTVTVAGLGGVWMPDAGIVTAASFTGPGTRELADTFRYNRATDTAVAGTRPMIGSRGLRPGDGYRLSVVLPPPAFARPAADPAGTADAADATDATDATDAAGAAGAAGPADGADEAVLQAAGPLAVSLPPVDVVLDGVRARAADLVGDATGPYARARAIEKALRQGYLSDGGQGQQPSDAGHYAARLNDMVTGPDTLVGDAEQYAALMAVMLRQLDVPARVVLGVRPSGDGGPRQVRGKDVTAWVEVGLQGVGWVPMFPTPVSDRKEPVQRPRPRQNPQVKEPPKVVVPPRSDTDVLGAGADDTPPDPPRRRAGGVPVLLLAGAGTVGGLLLVLLSAAATLAGLKAGRRSRRRKAGAPSTRIAAGWAELVDLAVDTGTVPRAEAPRRTRRELAPRLGPPGALALADRADAAVFAPEEPGEPEVRQYWAEVDSARDGWYATLGFRGRIRAALNPSSLRGGRAGRR